MIDFIFRYLRWLSSAILLCLFGYVEGQSQTIVFLITDSLTYTQRTITGAKHSIKTENENAEFYTFTLPATADSDIVYVDSIKKIHPSIIFTVGSSATTFAQKYFTTTPIVFSAVIYPVISGFVESFTRPGKNITGASLSIDADIQFRYFKKILPNLKNIGILYTDNTSSLIPPAQVTAKSMGLELTAIKVNTDKELPGALDSLAKTVDGLWSVADPNLFNPQSTKYILLNSLRKGLPFMGFSRYVVESGALFAIDFDYKAIGRQAGEITNKIIKGANPAEISVTSPDICWFHYNEKTASHLNIVIPDELAAVAKEVYR